MFPILRPRWTPSQRPVDPKANDMTKGIPHAIQVSRVYKGIDIRVAITSPTINPIMLARRVVPGIEFMFSINLRNEKRLGGAILLRLGLFWFASENSSQY